MRMKIRFCRECGEEFQYDWDAAPFRWYCDVHSIKGCLGDQCNVLLPRRGGNFCSMACRAVTYQGRGAKAWDVCECGEQFRKYQNRSRQRYCSKSCSKRFTHVGDRLRNNPELARQIGSLPKPNHGLRGHKQTYDHVVKRLGTGAIRASKEELSLVPTLTKLGFVHTGEGTFWRRWPDGTLHNPDFVDVANRIVVEYFGSYWHSPAEVEYAQQQWSAIGYTCRVIWDHEREVFLNAPAIAWGATSH